ncbi:MAG: Cys-tRNA(Pro) deacylase [Clostridia bacterium]|nr:Cys-tRNA(Pro) deacylase [Clostridia bacterium]
MTTNAVRQLKSAGISFSVREYAVDENDLSGMHIAKELGIDPDRMFKTLVTRGDKGNVTVFCIPTSRELALKKCAAVTGEKKVEPVHVRELLSLTGYIRGGCSPIGMKKKYPTFIDETAVLWDTVFVSAGVRGTAVEIAPSDLIAFTGMTVKDVTK